LGVLTSGGEKKKRGGKTRKQKTGGGVNKKGGCRFGFVRGSLGVRKKRNGVLQRVNISSFLAFAFSSFRWGVGKGILKGCPAPL